MATIKSVAIVGGSGNLGKYLVRSLASSDAFTVTVLSREGKQDTFPAGVKSIIVNYDDVANITEALKNQDAVVSVVPGQYSELQLKIIDAAIAAGVSRFIPSEFGSNIRNPNTRKMPLMREKVAVDEALKRAASQGKITYTAINGGPFVEWLLTVDDMMPIKQRKFFIYDGGDIAFTMTKMEDYGKAVVGVLQHVDATENKAVQIASCVRTQNELLELAKEAVPGEWTVDKADLNSTYDVAEKKLFAGQYDMSVISGLIFKAIFGKDFGGEIEGVHNDLLGIAKMTDEELKEAIRRLA